MPITVRCSQARARGPTPPPSQFQRASRARMSPAVQPTAFPPPLGSGFWDYRSSTPQSPPSAATPSGAFVAPRPLNPCMLTSPMGRPAVESMAPSRFKLARQPAPEFWYPAQNDNYQLRMAAPATQTPAPLSPVAAVEAPCLLDRTQEPCIVQLNPLSEPSPPSASGSDAGSIPVPPTVQPTPRAPSRLTEEDAGTYLYCDLCDSAADPSQPLELRSYRKVQDHWNSTGHRTRFATFAARGNNTRDGVGAQDKLIERIQAKATPIRESPEGPDIDNIIWEFRVDNKVGTVVDCELTVDRAFTDGLLFDPAQGGPPALVRNGLPVYQQLSTARIPQDQNLKYDPEVYLQFKFKVAQPFSHNELRNQAVKGLSRCQLKRLQKRAKANPIRLGTSAQVRVQQVGDPDPKVYCFDLPTQPDLRTEESLITIPLYAPYVGTDLCLIEVVIFTDNGLRIKTAQSCYHLFYHDVKHPLIMAAAAQLSKIQLRPTSAGFFPSTQPTKPESEAGPDLGAASLSKKHNHWRTECARRVGEAVRACQQRQRGTKSANYASNKSAKGRQDYLIDPAPTHKSCGATCGCRKEVDITKVPANDLMNPYRKFQQSDFIFMCQRDLLLSKLAYDVINHLTLRGARIHDYQVASNGANATTPNDEQDERDEDGGNPLDRPKIGPTVILELPDDNFVELLEPEGVRIGAFVEDIDKLQSGEHVPTHYVLEVQHLEIKEGRVLVTTTAPVDTPPPGQLRTFTILPDSRVLAAALSVVNLANYVPPEPGSRPKRAKRKQGPDDLGMDALDESDDEEEQEESKTRQKKLAIRDQLWYWCEHLWNPERPPPISTTGGQFPELNEEQGVVTKAIAETKAPVYLLWGPPGTGKTTTLGAGVAQFVKEGRGKAIVMAPTNTAADAVAKSIQMQLGNLGGDCKMVRVYGSHYRRALIPEELENSFYQWNKGTTGSDQTSPRAALGDARVVVCTLGTATLRHSALYDACGLFDLAAFDEAGRIGIANAFVPLTLAKRAIFCGDHKQMRPFFSQELQGLADFHWDVSILQLLIDVDHPWKQLVVNYRSVRRILEPSNKVLYADNPLEAGKHEERHAEASAAIAKHPWLLQYFPTGPGLSVIPVKGEGMEMFGGSSFGNLSEAFYVATFIVNAWISGLVTPGSRNVVGVVSFYRAQQTIIEKLLEAYETLNPSFQRGPWLTMMSAERFQGLEADWVLITGCRGGVDDSYEKGKRDLGFLGQFERINVGLTRARLGVAAFMRPPRYMRNRLWNEFLRAVLEFGGSAFSKIATRDPLEARMCLAYILNPDDNRNKSDRNKSEVCAHMTTLEVEDLCHFPAVDFMDTPDMANSVSTASTTLAAPASPQGQAWGSII